MLSYTCSLQRRYRFDKPIHSLLIAVVVFPELLLSGSNLYKYMQGKRTENESHKKLINLDYVIFG